MNRSNFEQNLERGRRAEVAVSEWLQGRGCAVIPSYDYAGSSDNKAPRIQSGKDHYVIPDLDVSHGGKRFWVEVKYNLHAAFNRKMGKYVHGIKRRHFVHYMAVEEVTGCKVWLFIYEEETERLLTASLHSLEPYPCQCCPCGKGEHWNCRNRIKDCVYFCTEDFVVHENVLKIKNVE